MMAKEAEGECSSIAKFSEWGSLYHLSADTIQALVAEGVDCEEALTGLKEAQLDGLKSKYRFNLGQHSLLRALWQLCNSRRGSTAASTSHSAAVESAKDAKESLRELFPAIYRKPRSNGGSSLSSQPLAGSSQAMPFDPKGKHTPTAFAKEQKESLPGRAFLLQRKLHMTGVKSIPLSVFLSMYLQCRREKAEIICEIKVYCKACFCSRIWRPLK